MFYFYQKYQIPSQIPISTADRIDYYYRILRAHYSMSLRRNRGLFESVKAALEVEAALGDLERSVVVVILKYALTCRQIKSWITFGNEEGYPYEIDFYRNNFLIGTKTINPENIQ